MIEEGVVTDGKWEYYAGRFNTEHMWDWEKSKKFKEDLIEKIKSVGIDWDRTRSPESGIESCFEGTFADSSEVETLLGTLYLKDGTEYMIGVSNAEKRFGAYVETLAAFMADKQRVKDILGE